MLTLHSFSVHRLSMSSTKTSIRLTDYSNSRFIIHRLTFPHKGLLACNHVGVLFCDPSLVAALVTLFQHFPFHTVLSSPDKGGFLLSSVYASCMSNHLNTMYTLICRCFLLMVLNLRDLRAAPLSQGNRQEKLWREIQVVIVVACGRNRAVVKVG